MTVGLHNPNTSRVMLNTAPTGELSDEPLGRRGCHNTRWAVQIWIIGLMPSYHSQPGERCSGGPVFHMSVRKAGVRLMKLSRKNARNRGHASPAFPI